MGFGLRFRVWKGALGGRGGARELCSRNTGLRDWRLEIGQWGLNVGMGEWGLGGGNEGAGIGEWELRSKDM